MNGMDLNNHIKVNRRYRKRIPDTIVQDKTEYFTWNDRKIANGRDIPEMVIVSKSDNFTYQYNRSYSKDIINKLIKDIEDGFYYSDRDLESKSIVNQDTNYISKYSDDGKLAYEKRIDRYSDRLTYFVYKPVVTKNRETGKDILFVKILLMGCIGHTFGNNKMFSVIDNPSLSEVDWW